MIPDERKIDALVGILSGSMDALAKQLPAGQSQVSGDDVIDLLAMGIAAVIENAKSLPNDDDIRSARDFADQKIERFIRLFKKVHDEIGTSALKHFVARAGATAAA